ncbi:hypothetical protein [Streptomyces sp. NPDC085665]|uniref:hypothetical protein n=1 Tax=Streptomyces sp. NPDC085665 TaxID=3365735 RepID=UPI0037D8E1D7
MCPECGFVLAQRELVRGEAAWNQGWRHGIPKDRQFITFRHNRTRREADARCPCGTIVELQYGHLSERQTIAPCRRPVYLDIGPCRYAGLVHRYEMSSRPGLRSSWILGAALTAWKSQTMRT